MITHYDIKMEMQKLKEVLSVEGVNIPSLLQVIKPGTYVFLWVLLWPTFLRLVSVKSDVRDVGFDICAREGANKRGNTSRLTQSFHFFMFEPIFSPVNALNQPI